MQISITPRDDRTFLVSVEDGRSTSQHEVTVWPSDLARYAPEATAEELIEASFQFLLQHEPKEAILHRFELPVIERYFPSYPAAMQARFP